jgi:hypothetical protein
MNADIQRDPDTCAIIGAAMAVGLDYRRLNRSGNHLRPFASSAVPNRGLESSRAVRTEGGHSCPPPGESAYFRGQLRV